MLSTKSYLHTSDLLPLRAFHKVTQFYLPGFSIVTCTYFLHVLWPQTVPRTPNHMFYKNASRSPWKLNARE